MVSERDDVPFACKVQLVSHGNMQSSPEVSEREAVAF
jgi:hypothetical protein